MIRLLIVDDHEIARAGVRALLKREEDIQVVCEAGTVADAVQEAARLEPDVILMDLKLPDGSGIDACRDILSAAPHVRILFLTSYSNEQAVLATVLAGAAGFLPKDLEHGALVRGIRDAAAGRPILTPPLAQPMTERMRAEALSGQERRVLELVVQGKTNKQIGAALALSEKTVKNYLSNAFQKLDISRRSEAATLLGTGRIPP